MVLQCRITLGWRCRRCRRAARRLWFHSRCPRLSNELRGASPDQEFSTNSRCMPSASRRRPSNSYVFASCGEKRPFFGATGARRNGCRSHRPRYRSGGRIVPRTASTILCAGRAIADSSPSIHHRLCDRSFGLFADKSSPTLGRLLPKLTDAALAEAELPRCAAGGVAQGEKRGDPSVTAIERLQPQRKVDALWRPALRACRFDLGLRFPAAPLPPCRTCPAVPRRRSCAVGSTG